MKTYDVICLGEALVDLISQAPGKDLADVKLFKKFAGGAPANVAVGLAHLGCQVAFNGKVGDDSFGRFLKNFLNRNGVNTELLLNDPVHRTRLAFVEIADNGERAFEFAEKHPADSALKAGDFSLEFLKRAEIVHFGSLPLTVPTNRKLFNQLINQLNHEKVLTSFDPNYRPALWKTPRSAKMVLETIASQCRILKVNLEEARLLSGTECIEELLSKLFYSNTLLLAITLGKDGCILKNRQRRVEIPSFKVKVADTTGCGDAFTAGLLMGLLKSGRSPGELDESELLKIGQQANAMAALTATRFGATETLLKYHEIDMFIKSQIRKRGIKK
ncbi:MAG: carbohydrate kinase [Candidatus Marinimicrobia bacterium]|nr:carbohydrate kinase [Candidatus Neomarinimicrobiota bacterium]